MQLIERLAMYVEKHPTMVFLLSMIGMALIGAVQPILQGYIYTGSVALNWLDIILSGLFFGSFIIIIWAIYKSLNFVFRDYVIRSQGSYLEFLRQYQAPISMSVARAVLTVSLALVAHKFIALLHADQLLLSAEGRQTIELHPKLFALFVALPEWPIEVYMGILIALALTAFLGVASRITFPLLWAYAALLVSWYEAPRMWWSHGNVVMFTASIPFLFRDIRGKFFLKLPGVEGPKRSDYLHIFYAQVLAGLFYFGAFYAKMIASGLAWISSDHMGNSIFNVWHYADFPLEQPVYIDLLLASDWLLYISSYGHLLMQALPVLILFSARKPMHRAFEGVVFAGSVTLLWAAMAHLWPWYWWWGIALLFVDFDYFAGVAKKAAHSAVFSSATSLSWTPIYIILFVVGFGTQGMVAQNVSFPFFDKLNFYSVAYDVYPFSEKNVARITERNGVILGTLDCQEGQQYCLDDAIRRPNHINSPLFRYSGGMTAEKMLSLLGWCEANPSSFCGGLRADGPFIGLYHEIVNMEYQQVRDRSTVFRGLTSFKEIEGQSLAVSSSREGDQVIIKFTGTGVSEIKTVRTLILDETRSQTLDGPEAVHIGTGVFAVPLAGPQTCMLGIELDWKNLRSVPMYIDRFCKWSTL